MSGLTVGFSDLTQHQFDTLVETYKRIKSEIQQSVNRVANEIHDQVSGNFGAPAGPAAPSAPAAPTAPTEVDKFGVPWNPNFHAGTKKMTNDGRWTLRKGCDKNAAAAWAQQYTGMGGQGQTPQPPAFGVPDQQSTTQPPAFGALPDAPRVIDYEREFVPLVRELSQAGIMNNDKGLEIIQASGVPDATHFAGSTPEAIAARTRAYDLMIELKKNSGPAMAA